MIFYFSGTGNSLWVALQIGKALETEVISMAGELRRNRGMENRYRVGKDDKIIFVFPVHSWGPAELVFRFVRSLVLEGLDQQPVYAVCVCGDTCGLTGDMLSEALAKRGINLTARWSLRMPNNYILMKGFGVDSDEIREAKLHSAPHDVDRIIAAIRGEQPYSHYVTGSMPLLKSRIINPLFRKFLAGPDSRTSFHADEKCIGCGLCVSVCPTGTITMHEGHPVWGRGCVQCTACIHRCPVRAIDWGDITRTQGRYHHPVLDGGGS